MKKTFGLIAAAMLLVGGVAFADEAILIDFTQLDADCCADDNGNQTQNFHRRPEGSHENFIGTARMGS